MTTRCVAFDEDEVTGLQLLERADIDLNYDAGSGFSAAVCRIDNEGCSFPEDSCFCQCEGIPCYFWSYWYWDVAGGEWIYSPLGSGNRSLGNGDVDAWVWAAGSSPSAEDVDRSPPDISFDEICALSTATPTATFTVTPTRTPTLTPTRTPTPIVVVVPITAVPLTPWPTMPQSPLPWPTSSQPESPLPERRTPTPQVPPAPASEPVSIPEPITLLLFGSGLAGLGVQAWRKRKGG